uniref:Uncharacterized protein n=1 Tax=Meloidogyne enterolobii TaxID=390850 RepID=A0A6V7WKB0_MELEN|nr:unnamed protein product [Meloidogyne enterolobii]
MKENWLKLLEEFGEIKTDKRLEEVEKIVHNFLKGLYLKNEENFDENNSGENIVVNESEIKIITNYLQIKYLIEALMPDNKWSKIRHSRQKRILCTFLNNENIKNKIIVDNCENEKELEEEFNLKVVEWKIIEYQMEIG